MKRYDSTNPNYINEIVKITKFESERTIKSLSDDEFEMLWKAVELVEEWTVGREDFIEKWIISGVHKKHGVIVEYLVNKNTGSVWFAKKDAIKLAIEGRLHAVVVHLKTGSVYLRPEFGSKPFKLNK